MERDSPDIMSCIPGVRRAIVLDVNILVLVSSLFALANFPSWYFSALKALTTLIPVRFSLDVWFRLSVSFCIILNFGKATSTSISIIIRSIPTAPAVMTLHSKPLPYIFIIAHTAIMGAFISICIPIAISIWTWVISFVVLVIKLLVEKFLISSILNDSTFPKMSFLKSREKVDATLVTK